MKKVGILMKKYIKYLIYIIVVVFFTINNVSADTTCKYYDASTYEDAQNAIELNWNTGLFWVKSKSAYTKKINGGDKVDVINIRLLEADFDYCPKYANLRQDYNGYFQAYFSDDLDEAATTADNEHPLPDDPYSSWVHNVTMSLNGEESSNIVKIKHSCKNNYEPNPDFDDRGKYTDFVLEGLEENFVYFKFETYEDNSRKFCVKISLEEYECADPNETVKVSYNDKTYSFKIQENYIDTFFDEVCVKDMDYNVTKENGIYILKVPDVISPGEGEEDKGCRYKDGTYYGPDGTSISKSEFESLCNVNCNIFEGEFGRVLKIALSFIRFLVPIIIIGLTIVDFIKATTAHDDSLIKQAANKVVKRLIIGVIIFVLPTIIEFVLGLADIEFGTCGIK